MCRKLIYKIVLCIAVALAWLSWTSLAMASDFSVDPQGSPIGGGPADIHTADGSALKITAADLGLPASVNIDGFSYGRDTVEPIGLYNYVVLSYSVDRQAQGNGGAISTQVGLNGAAGDKFNVRYVGYRGQFFPILGPRRISDAPIHNLDPLPLQSDLDGLSKGGQGNYPFFFTVDGAGVPGQPWGPADILVKWTPQPPSVDPVQRFASAVDLNLQPDDNIDGLALGARVGFDPPTAFGAGVIVWVSLTQNSPTRAQFGGESVLQVYPEVAVAADAPTLGILPSDELNALTAYDPGLPPVDGAMSGTAVIGAPSWTSLGDGSHIIKDTSYDIWSNQDSCSFVYVPVSGDVTIEVKVNSMTDTDPWAKAGVMIRESLYPGSKNVAAVVTASQHEHFQLRTETAGLTQGDTSPDDIIFPHWIRLQREGNTFKGSFSDDGSTWNDLHEESVDMSSDIYVGLAVTSHNSNYQCTVDFSNLEVYDASLLAIDFDATATGTSIGTEVTGDHLYDPDSGTHTVNNQGFDIWGYSDSFSYVYLKQPGDCEITARVADIDSINAYARAGVMIRESLDPDSAQAMMVVTKGGHTEFQNRRNTGDHSNIVYSDHVIPEYNWVRLTRIGNIFTGSYSDDGENWVQQPNDNPYPGDLAENPAEVFMGEDVHIGICFSNLYPYHEGRAVFDNVSISSFPSLCIYEASNPSPADGQVGVPSGCDTVLSWAQTVVSQDICVMLYIGTNRDEVENGTSDCYVLTGSETDPLFVLPFCTEPDTTYYWRVDVYNCRLYDPLRCPSEVWSFTTGSIQDEFWSLTANALKLPVQSLTTDDADNDECTYYSNGIDCLFPQTPQDIVKCLNIRIIEENSETPPTPSQTLSYYSLQADDDLTSSGLLDELFPCGDGPVGYTVCASSEPAVPGPYVLIIVGFKGDIPLQHDSHLYRYAAVFDSDGQTGNNYIPHTSFPNDFFSYTDKWYELTYDPFWGWEILVTDVRQGFALVQSNARVVIVGSEMAWFIPRGELDSDTAGWRITAFAHTGDWGLGGGFWSADYYPLVDDPLVPIPAPDTVIVIGQ